MAEQRSIALTRRLPDRADPGGHGPGGLTGAVLGPAAGGFGEVGKAVIGLIKTLAAPLILFAVIDAFLRTAVRARSGLLMVGIAAVNAAFAVAIGLMLSNALQPGRFLAVPAGLAPAQRASRARGPSALLRTCSACCRRTW